MSELAANGAANLSPAAGYLNQRLPSLGKENSRQSAKTPCASGKVPSPSQAATTSSTPPASSSKVLRHLLDSSGRPRRLLQSGPIRLEQGRFQRRSLSRASSSDGRSDTHQSQSTPRAAPRDISSSSPDIELHLPCIQHVSGRKDCINPVSWTLLHHDDTASTNEDGEDWMMVHQHLLSAQSPLDTSRSSSSSSTCSLSPSPATVAVHPPMHGVARPQPQRPTFGHVL